MRLFAVQLHIGDLGWRKGPLDKQLGIVRPVDHVDVLVLQLADDAMDAAAFHAHAGAYRVDPVVVGFHGNFGAFAGFADDLLDHDEAVEDLRDFDFQEFGQEQRAGPGQDDHGRIILQFHLLDDSPDILAFFEVVLGDLFGLRKDQFTAFFVEQENLLFPYLVDFRAYDLPHPIAIFLNEDVLFQIADPAGQGLFGSKDSAAAEIKDLHFFI